MVGWSDGRRLSDFAATPYQLRNGAGNRLRPKLVV
jgi:hypothetical protein